VTECIWEGMVLPKKFVIGFAQISLVPLEECGGFKISNPYMAISQLRIERYVMLCTLGFVDDVTFAHHRSGHVTTVEHKLKIIHQGAEWI